jgi:hypothetical protein
VGDSGCLPVALRLVPTSARMILDTFSANIQCVNLLHVPTDAAALVAGRSGVRVMLGMPAFAKQIDQACSTLAAGLGAAAQHARRLEETACAHSSAREAFMTATSGGQQHNTDMPIWRQVLGSEQGRQLPQALMDFGSLLCAALPSRFGCNEPSCCCLDKPSELQLVGGKGTKCSGCGVTRYCSMAHQRMHWKQHKPACKAIAAASKAASGAPEPAAGPVKS